MDALLAARAIPVTALVREPGKGAGRPASRGVRIAPGDLGSMERAPLGGARPGRDLPCGRAGRGAERGRVPRGQSRRDRPAARGGGRRRPAPHRPGVLARRRRPRGPGCPLARRRGAAPGHRLRAEQARRRAGGAPRPASLDDRAAAGGLWPVDTEMLRVFRAAKLGVAPVFGDGAQELSLVYGPDLGRGAGRGGPHCRRRRQDSLRLPSRSDHQRGAGSDDRPTPWEDGATASAAPLVWPGAALAVTGALARVDRAATLLTPDKANEFFAPAWTCDPARSPPSPGGRRNSTSPRRGGDRGVVSGAGTAVSGERER